ncbi:WbqC family protein [Nocardiopsis sp. HNM0947]|uniref:WbqC family protein n=1 Tax=Nocardiopsis coralli TaxID=2772213 RepID=A0ABR9PAV0_9ACTN|nr:WbqC family protein [Nocardiopsis coralli]MBE3000964.1 WbqC family protein [Nocardiopsis coralli]
MPWLGLIDKIDRSDLYVVLDTVQFERRGWQNRNHIAGDGGTQLLTVPVIQAGRHEVILDKRIDNTQKWRSKHLRAILDHSYRGTPYLDEYRERISRIYEQRWDDLAELSIATTRLTLEAFGIDTPVVRASRLGEFPGRKSELIAQVCAAAGADTLISGSGARDYLDTGLLKEHGVEVEWQGFEHPVYRQHHRGADGFISHLAAIDLLFNAGPDSLGLLRGARRPL